MSEKKRIVALSLDPDVIDEVDKTRGSVSRSSFIENRIREALETERIKELILRSCDEILSFLSEKIPPKIHQEHFSFHALMVVREVEKKLLGLKTEILQST